jgi:hypothetical protein
MRRRSTLLLIPAVLLCVGSAVQASTTITLQQRYGVYEGTEDAWLDEAPSYNQDDNYGNTVNLSIRYNSGYSDCALVKFNLVGQIPANQRILSATLTLYYNDAVSMTGSDDAITIKPFRVNSGAGWYENTGDGLNGQGVNYLYRDQSELYPWTSSRAWNDCTDDGNGTALIEGSGGTVPGAIQPGNAVSWDVRPSVAMWYGTNNNGAENNGLLLVGITNHGAGDIKAGLFDSSEKFSYNWYNNPKLTITCEGALKPLAEAAGPYLCLGLGSVQLNGTGSNDPDGGTIQTWSWDLDGDLDYADAAGSAPNLDYDYLRNTLGLPFGDNPIYLKVKDDENEWCLNPDNAVLTLLDPLSAVNEETPAAGPVGLTVAPVPFTERCRIEYRLDSDGIARVLVLDVTGRAVRTLMSGWQRSGDYSFTWDGRSDGGVLLPSGVYLASVHTGGGRATSRLVRAR